eukprot:3624700-Prorocentrum_lima.AAC.1
MGWFSALFQDKTGVLACPISFVATCPPARPSIGFSMPQPSPPSARNPPPPTRPTVLSPQSTPSPPTSIP